MTAPQQFSPDGQWWWDGSQWVPAANAPTAQQASVPQQPAYPTAYGQVPYGYPLPPKSKTDGKAIGSLIASLIWVCGINGIVAVILGHLSRSQARREGRDPSGLALAGLIIGYLGMAATVAIGLVIYSNRHTIARGFQSDIELQSAAYAERDYHDANGQYAQSLEQLRPYGYDDLDGHIDVTVVSASPQSFCFSARSFGQTFYVSDRHLGSSTSPCR